MFHVQCDTFKSEWHLLFNAGRTKAAENFSHQLLTFDIWNNPHKTIKIAGPRISESNVKPLNVSIILPKCQHPKSLKFSVNIKIVEPNLKMILSSLNVLSATQISWRCFNVMLSYFKIKITKKFLYI